MKNYAGLAVVVCIGALVFQACSDDCVKNVSIMCSEGTTYRVDSCGKQGNKVEDCECGCNSSNSACKKECICVPDCGSKLCGPDPICGESCGDCYNECTGVSDARLCVDGQCTQACCPATCEELSRLCGFWDDLCGGVLDCGPCGLNEACNMEGVCECGFVECDGECCGEGDVCYYRSCCTPNCSVKECGEDGCGGMCPSDCTDEELCIYGSCVDGGLDWVSIPSGTFMMGSDSGDNNEQPVHQVDILEFEMTRTEVTVWQYKACVDAGECTEPDDYTVDSHCSWGQAGRESHPANCVDYFQATAFCEWVGGRLPSESEWEYAARSGGQDVIYPWGNDRPTCIYAVMDDTRAGGRGCGYDRTWPVCSKTAGITEQGLCDMAGNVSEWVQDCWHMTYEGAPSNQISWDWNCWGPGRIVRGGDFFCFGIFLSTTGRYGALAPWDNNVQYGFRCARWN